jgi:hypothetical protein
MRKSINTFLFSAIQTHNLSPAAVCATYHRSHTIISYPVTTESVCQCSVHRQRSQLSGCPSRSARWCGNVGSRQVPRVIGLKIGLALSGSPLRGYHTVVLIFVLNWLLSTTVSFLLLFYMNNLQKHWVTCAIDRINLSMPAQGLC